MLGHADPDMQHAAHQPVSILAAQWDLLHDKERTPESCLPQALSKRHSTTEEALRVAADMGAYRHILTHFSQRYPKIPIGIPASGGLRPSAWPHPRCFVFGLTIHRSLLVATECLIGRCMVTAQGRQQAGSWSHLMGCAYRSPCFPACRPCYQPCAACWRAGLRSESRAICESLCELCMRSGSSALVRSACR